MWARSCNPEINTSFGDWRATPTWGAVEVRSTILSASSDPERKQLSSSTSAHSTSSLGPSRSETRLKIQFVVKRGQTPGLAIWSSSNNLIQPRFSPTTKPEPWKVHQVLSTGNGDRPLCGPRAGVRRYAHHDQGCLQEVGTQVPPPSATPRSHHSQWRRGLVWMA